MVDVGDGQPPVDAVRLPVGAVAGVERHLRRDGKERQKQAGVRSQTQLKAEQSYVQRRQLRVRDFQANQSSGQASVVAVDMIMYM